MRSEKNHLVRTILDCLQYDKDLKAHVVQYASYSDYSGCAVELTNQRYLKKKYNAEVDNSGWYGSSVTYFEIRDLFSRSQYELEEIADDLTYLDQDPVLDDNLLSEIEMNYFDDCLAEKHYDLEYEINQQFKRDFPGLPVQTVLDDKINPETGEPYFNLSEYLEANPQVLDRALKNGWDIEYSGTTNFFLRFTGGVIPADLWPERNGYELRTGTAINGNTVKGWVKL